MRTGRPKVELKLSNAERSMLETWTRRRNSAQALSQRARIVLLCAGGKNNSEVASELKVSKGMVGKWRNRFVAKRLDGLLDEPRPGAPRKISDADVERVLTVTLETTPRVATHWSTRSLAERCGISQSTVSRVWRAFALQPHRSDSFLFVPCGKSFRWSKNTGLVSSRGTLS
jgi:transposase